MADTLYAWTEIRVGDASPDQKAPGKTTVIAYGDTVTKDKLKTDDAGLQEYVDSGAVRKVKPPELPDNFDGSPLDFLRQKREEDEKLASAITTGGALGAPTEMDVLLGTAETDDEGLFTQAEPEGGIKSK